jgi:hypothetical protein
MEVRGFFINSVSNYLIFYGIRAKFSHEQTYPSLKMSASVDQTTGTHPNTHPISFTENALIALTITTQINEKLMSSTFPQWRAQFQALLNGYNLLDYVHGVSQCPSPAGTSLIELNKTHWVHQDKLILSAILASTSPTITPLIVSSKASHEAWKKLYHMYASKSRTRAMQLKEELTLIQRGNRSIHAYLQAVKALADEIALIDHPIFDDDITLYILNGLGADFREIAAPIRARETSLTFEELHDILVGHDSYLRRLESSTQQLVASTNYSHHRQQHSGFYGESYPKGSYKINGHTRSQNYSKTPPGPFKDNRRPSTTRYPQRRYQPKCQFCDQMGHTANSCPQLLRSEVTANCTSASQPIDQKWLLDSATYLINHQPTPLLQNKSPFESLCGQKSNYLKLKSFGYICYPLLKPYNTYKIQPKSTPCVFIWYFLTQNTYRCLEPISNRIYLSRHVLFDEQQTLASFK